MKDIAIFGAGGFGREVACLITSINRVKEEWHLIGFFDDGKDVDEKNEYGSILGGMDALNHYEKELAIVIAVGNPGTIEKIYNRISNKNVYFPNIISPAARIFDSENMKMGRGNIICMGSWISCNVCLGDFNVVNVDTNLAHDCNVGNFNAFMPSVKISGEVNIGNKNFFGVCSVVLQQLRIGDNNVIGANSTILKNIGDESTYIGNPARKLNLNL